MQKLALHVAAISLFCAGSAVAADMRMPVKAPPAPAPVAYNWTGCYVGAGGGYGLFDQESQAFEGSTSTVKNDNGGRGWLATVQVGCDFQVSPRIVIGAFADFDWSGIKGDMAVPGADLVGREKLKNSWAAGGRIGYIPFERLLVFVSGGYTQARFGSVAFTDVGGDPTSISLAKHTYAGWFLGSGYEYGLNWFPGLFWKTEYRFADYGKDRLNFLDDGLPTGATLESRKFVHTVRSELVWRFNWGGAPVTARY